MLDKNFRTVDRPYLVCILNISYSYIAYFQEAIFLPKAQGSIEILSREKAQKNVA